ncbi:MAG TPA: nuclear transport factor 2 family protein [Candidatus Polarisedimenticolia bacterium]|nr:nuclear transport factor 2 family protein [Candidatus Polarisedimenticolia bacterium]
MLPLLLLGLLLHAPEAPVTAAEADRQAILAHIDGLFQAYFRGDLPAIRRGHTADWTGFQIGSREIVRGIDAYMKNAEAVLARFRGVRYVLEDVQIDLHGDRAVVFYVAREWVLDDEGKEKEIRLRSVDLYRRERGGWNQEGSHIALLPSLP